MRVLVPVGIEGGGVAELVGLELERGFAARGGPEFFTPFDAAADLFDRRFDVAAGDWQAHRAHDVVCESAQKMTKPETRNPKEVPNPKVQTRTSS